MSETTFEPGDIVRCIDGSGSAYTTAGNLYRVARMDEDFVELEADDSGRGGGGAFAHRFEKPEPKYKVGDRLLDQDGDEFKVEEIEDTAATSDLNEIGAFFYAGNPYCEFENRVRGYASEKIETEPEVENVGGFAVGDRVIGKANESGSLAGSIGTVVRLQAPFIRVEFDDSSTNNGGWYPNRFEPYVENPWSTEEDYVNRAGLKVTFGIYREALAGYELLMNELVAHAVTVDTLDSIDAPTAVRLAAVTELTKYVRQAGAAIGALERIGNERPEWVHRAQAELILEAQC